MTPLRLAVVGAGHLGRVHARIAKGLDGVELVGIADPVQPAREALAAEHGVASFAHHRELLGRVDAAVVAAPTRFHHAVACDLLAAGIHLLVEKPLASSLVEADEMVALAERCGRVLQVGHVERFNPALTAALPHVRDPKYIECCRAGVFSFRSTDIGVVHDLMIHDLDLVLSLVRSPVRRVDALGISVFGTHEDVAHARLEFENGCVATLGASRASYSAVRTMHVWSTGGFTSLDFGARQTTVVRPSDALMRREVRVEELTPEQIAHLKEHLFEEWLAVEHPTVEACDQITAEQVDFVSSIRAGRAPRVDGRQAREALSVADQILASIDAHTWDGTSSGRVGKFALPNTMRGPHWHLSPQHAPVERKAG
ncbi:MAG: Gfo/Idh/MocA family oxidoreductase [Pirellulales bacterium]|nr:Gfo/Idh/MocA family oxidoreductase [Pirellulales bacterium]